MKLISSIFLFLISSTLLCAQFDSSWGYINANQADSLKTAVVSEMNDTLKMEAFRKLGFYLGELDNDKSLNFHKRQLKLAEKLKLKIWEADAHSQIADQYRELKNYKKAYDHYSRAVHIASDKKTEKPNWHVWNFSNAQNEHEARISTLGMTYLMFGNFYRDVNLPEKAKPNYNRALELGKSIENGKIISLFYVNQNVSQDSTLQKWQLALKWANKAEYYKQHGWIYIGMCTHYWPAKQMDSVKVFLYKAMESSLKQNLNPALIQSRIMTSYFYSNESKLDSSTFYAKEALKEAKKLPNNLLVWSYRNMAHKYSLVNSMDSAYIYETFSTNLSDSLSKVQLDRMTDYQQVLFEEELQSQEDENKQRLLALIAGLGIALIVALILFRNNRQKQNANKSLETTLSNLKSTQAQLIQSEKMASLGELTAGIAHEIQNPLNFVNNFSEVSNELIDEMNEEIAKGDLEEAKLIAKDIQQNLTKINHHGKRADAIVKGMLQHSRKSTAEKEPTDLNKLADEYLRLAYHGLRAKDKSFNATLETDFDENIGLVNVIPQDIGRVILNLITNAFYAVNEKLTANGSQLTAASITYNPTVSVKTLTENNTVKIEVKDNGNGIPKQVVDKIFQPFFTTKPTGEGTGLGLSMSYDIVTKGHNGELKVLTTEGAGTEFVIILPVTKP